MEGTLGSRYVHVHPWRLHCLASVDQPAREGPPIVLVHGMGVSSRHMEPAARHLAPRFPVFVPDLPGYGRSPKPWSVLGVRDLARVLEDVMDELEIERAVLASISFGCQIVIELAAESPERVMGCVLVGPTIDVDAADALSQVSRLLLDAPREPLNLMPVIARDYWDFGIRRGAITLWHALSDDVVDKLPRVTAPTVVVRGERDLIVPRSWTDRVAELLPDARSAEIAGAAHAANFSHPEEFARLIEDLVTETEAERGEE